MPQFTLSSHLECFQNYQGFAYTEFVFEAHGQEGADQLVESFLQSSAYAYDSLYDCIKAKPNSGYLERAFNFDVASLVDFKQTNSTGVTDFLLEFKTQGFWAEDLSDYNKLLESYFDIPNKNAYADCYILSKDWFLPGDPKVFEPQAWCYTYYFLIVSVDLLTKTLTLSEWIYD